ncbi:MULTISPECIES: efflux RND transporter periplasmic adaptor subunit [Pseudoalteromonas]|uniref:efflux RND transporter periplasmic adaptor subunit n=1 Tax=Pseudoalteromonas TaxID=53246 RepID=UPI000FFEF331|nr:MULTISPECIES: efflux RND transporter periplasmic adaptor subunit [Pseudoalteromonas]NKC21073.1 efflux RND transporter periplasmic adaptor subunit [Pseudoalteromonas galatheae]RXE87757.1 efflux transporter periplasmic adaptor subunit [Pseudoalteromonas sp. A757]
MAYIPDTSAQDSVVERPKKNKLVILAIGIVALISIYFMLPIATQWLSGQTAVSSDKIHVSSVKRGDFVRDISVQGKVVAARRPTIYSPAQGTVTYLVESGDSVVEGQALAVLDSPELKSEFAQHQAELSRLETELQRQIIQAKKQDLAQENYLGKATVVLNAAKREMRRSENGLQTQVVSDIDYQKAKDDLENAEREYRLAIKEVELLKESQKFEIRTKELEFEAQKVKVAELERQVDALKIASPVSGLVGNLAVEQKNTVAKNQPLLSVVDLSKYEIEVQIPESYSDDLALGMLAEVNLNGDVYTGEIVAISPEIENGRVAGKIRFKDESIQGLRQNQRLTSRIVIEQKQNIAYLPHGQYLDAYNGQFAYVVKEGSAIKTPIQIGLRSIGQVEVLSGLNVGDQVITSDARIFKDAPSVKIIQ